MEITKENAEQASIPPNSTEDHHWVEKLFPPHFTIQNLLENQTNASAKHFTGTEEPQRGNRRQIYLTALKEVQHIERLQKKEALAKKIRHEPSVNRLHGEKPTCENLPEQSPHCNESMDEKPTCIWQETDITKLRTGFGEMTRDRCRLMHKLSYTEEQLKAERKQRRRLQELVEELEEQLSLSRKKSARQSLTINDLKTGGQQMNIQMNVLAIQVREKEEEVHGYKTNLSKVKKDMHQIEQERSSLALELGRVQAQQKTERDKLEKVAQIENEAALLKLQRELEQVKAELCAERDSHTRGRAALDLLRTHFSSQ
ncbi:coiled-coil domain-containing protein 160 homolog [Misgurnus anguillicaudatus]|uniref:coiled-coil domain-containing protein 160 homolog n=1 Tax=Misgurnus anguillicaudatus TaxID=75329 RepID=UPI003CCF0746